MAEYLIPRVEIMVREEVVPPLPSGPGVLGIVADKVGFLAPKDMLQGAFSSLGEFLAEVKYRIIQKYCTKDIRKSEDSECASLITKIIPQLNDTEPDKSLKAYLTKLKERSCKLSELQSVLFEWATEKLNNIQKSIETKPKKSESAIETVKTTTDAEKHESEEKDEKLAKKSKEAEPEFGENAKRFLTIAKDAFNNGLPKLRVLLKQDSVSADELQTFRESYPEIDLLVMPGMKEEDLAAYVKTSQQLAQPCIGFFAKPITTDDKSPKPGLVYVAPEDAVGAVIGQIAALPYYESPTFKSLNFSREEILTTTVIEKLISAGVLPVAKIANRGWCVVKGIMADGEEISVRRITNYVVRGVKAIGDSFIGLLNTEDGRDALRQKINEFLTAREREQALVAMFNPATGKTSPAFTVNVTSNPSDFSHGIVKIAMAIRPVRAMNYIDVTINVLAT